jgi:hypothetical protein
MPAAVFTNGIGTMEQRSILAFAQPGANSVAIATSRWHCPMA